MTTFTQPILRLHEVSRVIRVRHPQDMSVRYYYEMLDPERFATIPDKMMARRMGFSDALHNRQLLADLFPGFVFTVEPLLDR